MDQVPWHALPSLALDPSGRTWVSRLALLGYARNTVLAYARGLDHHLRFCRRAAVDVTAAEPQHIVAYVSEWSADAPGGVGTLRGAKTRLAGTTLTHRLTVLRLFYDHLVDEGARTSNPVPHCRAGMLQERLKAAGQGVAFRPSEPAWIPDDGELRRIMRAFRDGPVRNRLMVAFAYEGALRCEELCLLRVDDVDPGLRLLSIRPETTKTKAGRVVAYTAHTSELLAAYMAERRRLGSTQDALFLSVSSRNHGEAISARTWSRVVRSAGLRVGLPRLKTHTFRHLALTELARAGGDAQEIARFAGHRSVASAQPYIHLTARDLSGPVGRVLAPRPCGHRLQVGEQACSSQETSSLLPASS